MRMKMFFLLFIFYGIIFSQNDIQNVLVEDLVAHWTFDNTDNLTEAKIGNALVLNGSHVSVEGPNDSSAAIRIGVGSYYSAEHGITPNGGGNKVNIYTIVMDIKIPASGQWYTIYQTETANTADGDWFIGPNGNMGVGHI